MRSDDPDYWCIAEALTLETHGGSSVCVSQFLAQQIRQRMAATNPQVIPCGITLPTAQVRAPCEQLVHQAGLAHRIIPMAALPPSRYSRCCSAARRSC